MHTYHVWSRQRHLSSERVEAESHWLARVAFAAKHRVLVLDTMAYRVTPTLEWEGRN